MSCSGDLGPEGLQRQQIQVVGEGAGRGLPAQGCVDRRPDAGINVEDDGFLPVSKEYGASRLGGKQRHGFNAYEVWHHKQHSSGNAIFQGETWPSAPIAYPKLARHSLYWHPMKPGTGPWNAGFGPKRPFDP